MLGIDHSPQELALTNGAYTDSDMVKAWFENSYLGLDNALPTLPCCSL